MNSDTTRHRDLQEPLLARQLIYILTFQLHTITSCILGGGRVIANQVLDGSRLRRHLSAFDAIHITNHEILS